MRDWKTGSRNGAESGFSLVELMMATGLLGLLCFLLTQQSSIFLKSQHNISSRMSVEQIGRRIVENIDCDLTMRNAGIGYSSQGCSADSFQQDGAVFLNPYKSTGWGSKSMFQGDKAADGSYEYGDYKIRVSCSSNEGTFIVQVVPKSSGSSRGSEWKDKLPNGRPKSLVIGAAANKKLCYNNANAGQISRARVNGSSSAPFPGSPSSAFSRGEGGGVACNQSKGWSLVSCYANDNNIAAVPNGCAPRGGAATIVCMKAN